MTPKNNPKFTNELKLKSPPETEGKWYLLGEMSVDAGMWALGDPCYFLTQDCSNHGLGFNSWSEFCDFLHPDDENEPTKMDLAINFNGTMLMGETGFGDGAYEVYVKVHNFGRNDVRITEMKVIFISNETEDDFEDEYSGRDEE